MITEFEARLATVLGSRLPPPLSGTVSVSGNNDSATGSQTRIFLGVFKTEFLPQGFGGNRNRQVPGAEGLRRVMPLRCYININVVLGAALGRDRLVVAIEQLHYLLDTEDFQTGRALLTSGDQGFLISQMLIANGAIRVTNAPDAGRPVGVTLVAEGIFWPVGVPGETGSPIEEIRLRGITLSIRLNPSKPEFQAGGSVQTLSIQITATSALRIGKKGPPLTFNRIAVDLQQPDGQPGAGLLSGGTAGSGTLRHFDVIDSVAEVNYSPPATPSQDILLVGFDDGADGLGQVMARFPIIVR